MICAGFAKRVLRLQSSPASISASSAAPRICFASSSPVMQRLIRPCETVMMRRSSDFSLTMLNVAFEVIDLRQPIIERNQVAEPVDRLQLAVLHQLVGERDAINSRLARADPPCAGKSACAFPD